MSNVLKDETQKAAIDLLASLKGKKVDFDKKEIVIADLSWNNTTGRVMILGSKGFRLELDYEEIIPALQNRIENHRGYIMPGGEGYDSDLAKERNLSVVPPSVPELADKELTLQEALHQMVAAQAKDSKEMSSFLIKAGQALLNKEIGAEEGKAVAQVATSFYKNAHGQREMVKILHNISKTQKDGDPRNPKN